MSDPKTMSVPAAGEYYFGLKRQASYDAAKRGDFPVIKIGKKLRVPVAALEKMLTEAKPLPRHTEDAEEILKAVGVE
jgi:Helix-turn-helix domain